MKDPACPPLLIIEHVMPAMCGRGLAVKHALQTPSQRGSPLNSEHKTILKFPSSYSLLTHTLVPWPFSDQQYFLRTNAVA